MRISVFIIFAVSILFLFGCSTGNAPTNPNGQDTILSASGPQIIGMIDFSYDENTGALSVEPSRQSAEHYNVTKLISPKHLKLQVISWDAARRVLTVKATIDNPTKIDVYDVRGILPDLGAKILLNPDAYTKLFDKNSPPIANPFRAFAKDEARWKLWGNYASPPQYTKSEIYEIYFPSVISASVLFTASFPGNAPEPYAINDIQQTGDLYVNGGSLDITADVLHWDDITASQVLIEANPITVNDVDMAQTDATHWAASITNSGNAPEGDYDLWIAAYDATYPQPLYNKLTVHVNPIPGEWGDPVCVACENTDDTLPRIAIQNDNYWIIYTNGADVFGRYSTDHGLNWDATTYIGSYPAIDRLHAVVGDDNGIYVEYQRSDTKYLYTSKWNGTSWSTPVDSSYHGMTAAPYTCELGIGADGYIYKMLGDYYSGLGFRSTAPWDVSTWIDDHIATFYDTIFCVCDGFVQNATVPKLFFTHNGTELDYAWYSGGWQKAAARTGTQTFVKPAIAPESDGPYHGVMGVSNMVSYYMEYFRYDTWPPTTAHTVTIKNYVAQPGFSSISVEGDMISILFDADGSILYIESKDGGDTFGTPVSLSEPSDGVAKYSHIRRDPDSSRVVAAYVKMTNGSNNIYVRIKN